jgi:non-heme chloroperoxidase
VTLRRGCRDELRRWEGGSEGWPVTQILYFLAKGYRVIASDRRGHGRSSDIGTGHDMDH